jgi:hypothetical protein
MPKKQITPSSIKMPVDLGKKLQGNWLKFQKTYSEVRTDNASG